MDRPESSSKFNIEGQESAFVESPSQNHSARARKPRGSRGGDQTSTAVSGNAGAARSERKQDNGIVDPDAAGWAHRESYPEGRLGAEAAARIRAAKASLRSVSRAFGRHACAIGRSEESLRRALGRSYALGQSFRDQPELINGLLEDKRIKITKPIRENVFLAVLRVANPGAAPDTVTRWAGALACAAANNCTTENIPAFVRATGIREAADRWAEIRRAARPRPGKPAAPKPDPVETLRQHSLGVRLTGDLPVPEGIEGPFILVVEPSADGVVALGTVIEPRLVSTAVRRAAPVDGTA